MPNPNTRISSSPRFYWLDLIRFLCALMVMLVHTRGTAFVQFGSLPASQQIPPVAFIFALIRPTDEAVIVFFVLSGFLVGGRALEKMICGQFRPMEYAIERFARVMPPLFFALIFTAIIQFMIGGVINPWVFLGNLFSLQGILVKCFGQNLPLWSLSYEVWFYVLVWAIGLSVFKRSFYIVSVLWIFLIFAIFTRLNPIYLFCWLFGVFAYMSTPEKRSSLYFFSSVIIFLYGFISMECGTESFSVSVGILKRWVPPFDIATILFAAGAALLIQQLILIIPEKPIAVKIDQLGTKLAAFSYTLYLTHFPTVLGLRSFFKLTPSPILDINSVGIYLFLVTMCLISGYVIYWFTERRTPDFRRWLNRLVLGAGAGDR